jgi:hypothetical protein
MLVFSESLTTHEKNEEKHHTWGTFGETDLTAQMNKLLLSDAMGSLSRQGCPNINDRPDLLLPIKEIAKANIGGGQNDSFHSSDSEDETECDIQYGNVCTKKLRFDSIFISLLVV